MNPNNDSFDILEKAELIKIAIEAPKPMKNPKTLEVPIANLEGTFFFIK